MFAHGTRMEFYLATEKIYARTTQTLQIHTDKYTDIHKHAYALSIVIGHAGRD